MKTISKVFLLAMFVLIQYSILAQNNTHDVVYLKNGDIKSGTIIENLPNDYIRIKTFEGTEYFYKMNEIKRVSKERDYDPGRRNRQKWGYYGIFEFGNGLLFSDHGGSQVDDPSTSLSLCIDVINGYRINPWIAVGAGVGLRTITYDLDFGFIIPLYADIRANLSDKNVTPYLSSGIGYGFGVSDEGGFLFNSSLGFSWKINRRKAFNLCFAYELTGKEYSVEHITFPPENLFAPTYPSISYTQHSGFTHTFNIKIGFAI